MEMARPQCDTPPCFCTRERAAQGRFRFPAFNAQCSRLIIVVVQVRVVKIYVAAVEALRKKERQDESQFTTKIDAFLSFTPLPPEC
jgi:hypothetical protein